MKTHEEHAKAIESKRRLLTYLRCGAKRVSLESYVCLTQILTRAGWVYDTHLWSKAGTRLPTLEAASAELEQQIAYERDRLLQQTVASYASASEKR